MAAKGIEAGRAFMRLFIDDKGFRKGLDAAAKRLKSMGSAIAGVGKNLLAGGAAITTPFIGAAKLFASTGESLAKLSTQTGESVESLSALRFAATKVGVDFDDLVGAAEELNIRLGEAARDGSGPLAETFAKLGLDANKLIAVPLPERLATIGDALNSLGDNAARGFAADEIFGGDAFRLAPLLAANIGDLTDEAQRLGLVMSGQAAEDATKLASAFRVVLTQAKAVAATIGSAIVGDLTKFLGTVSRVAASVLEWAKNNGPLLATMFKVGVGVAAVGAALVTLGGVVAGAGVALSGLSAAAGAIGAAFSALLSPIGIAIAAITGIGVAIVTFTDVGSIAIKFLQDQFANFAKIAGATFQGVVDALSAGDLKLAGQVAFAGLVAVVAEAKSKIYKVWSPIAKFLASAWATAVSAVVVVIAGLQTAWVATVNGMRKAWAIFREAVIGGWATAQNYVTRSVLKLQKMIYEAFTGKEFNIEIDLKAADDKLNATRAKLAKETDQSISNANDARDSALGRIRQDLNGSLQAIDQQERQRRRAIDEELKASQQAAVDARMKLEGFAAEAKGAKEAVEAAGGDGPGDSLKDRLAKAAAGVQGGINAQRERIESRGTFSGRAAAAGALNVAGGPMAGVEKKLGDGNALLQRIAKNTRFKGIPVG